jgi:hypothetical protein
VWADRVGRVVDRTHKPPIETRVGRIVQRGPTPRATEARRT